MLLNWHLLFPTLFRIHNLHIDYLKRKFEQTPVIVPLLLKEQWASWLKTKSKTSRQCLRIFTSHHRLSYSVNISVARISMCDDDYNINNKIKTVAFPVRFRFWWWIFSDDLFNFKCQKRKTNIQIRLSH